MKGENKAVTKYWLEYYCDEVCSLCGNYGFIDTRNRATSPAGHVAGKVNYCICPNGQILRREKAELPKQGR